MRRPRGGKEPGVYKGEIKQVRGTAGLPLGSEASVLSSITVHLTLWYNFLSTGAPLLQD